MTAEQLTEGQGLTGEELRALYEEDIYRRMEKAGLSGTVYFTKDGQGRYKRPDIEAEFSGWRFGYLAQARRAIEPQSPASARCEMGVGCDEAGVCFAAANGQPERCARPARDGGVSEAVERLNKLAAMTTVDPTPLDAYGRCDEATFGDLRTALAALTPKEGES